MTTEPLSQLAESLAVLGTNDEIRQHFTNLLVEAENILSPIAKQKDVRSITAPIMDALYARTGILCKALQDETLFEFRYRPWIVRDFLLSQPPIPNHVWEPQTTKLLLYLAEHANQVIVGGAYFGDHAILLSKKLAQHNGVCHAFEPSVEQSDMLRRNAVLNHLSNIRIHRKGLWDQSNIILSLVGDDALASSKEAQLLSDTIASISSSTHLFSTITIDEYLTNENIQTLDLLMLDVEGAEEKVLHGAEYSLGSSSTGPNIIFEVHSHYVDWSNGLENTTLLRYLSTLGYSCYAIRDIHSNYDMGEKPIELIPSNAVYLEGPPHGFNMLAIKETSLINAPLFKMCKNVSPKLLPHKDPSLHHPFDGFP